MSETAKHGAGHSRTVLLFNAAHLHTQVACFDDHTHTLGTNFFLNGLCDLAGHALLNLQPASEHVYQAGDFAQSEHTLVRQVSDMGLAEEREQVVFAEAEELNIFHDDHLVVGDAEGGAVEKVVNVLMIATGEKLEGLFEALRGLAQSLAIRVFANQFDDFAHMAGDPPRVNFLTVIEQDFFCWFGHSRFPSGLSPEYSKLFFPVSSTRMRSSLALGKDFKRWKISMHTFSVVGTRSRNAGTSSLSDL